MTTENIVNRAWRPLESRKVRVALATVIAAFAANWGFAVEEELIFTILGIGASLILGIAHEDAGRSQDRIDSGGHREIEADSSSPVT